MPRFFRANDLVVSEEVFTIEDNDEQFDEKMDDGPDFAFEEGGDPSQMESGEDDDFVEEKIFTRLTTRSGGAASGSGEPQIGSLSVARREAEEILQQAREEASMIVSRAEVQSRLDHDRLLEQTAAEMESIKRQAHDEAFQQGLQEGLRTQVQKIEGFISRMEQSIAALEGEQAGFMAEYEYNLKWLAWEIASKVLGKRIAEDETEMVSLVKTAVASVKNAEWITIEVSEKMTGLVDQLARELKASGEERIEVRGIAAPEGTCVIDTPSNMIDASVYSQLENLRLYFAHEDD